MTRPMSLTWRHLGSLTTRAALGLRRNMSPWRRIKPSQMLRGGLAGGGNDDCGEMSAWYVLTQLGLYSEFPGRPEFVISTPRFKKITIRLRSPYKGRQFIINAPGAGGKDMYIQSCTIDGRKLSQPWLPESAITSGGTWNVHIGPRPNKAWGSAGNARPWSMSTGSVVRSGVRIVRR